MEREKWQYYRITINNYLEEGGTSEEVFAVYENKNFYELLTGKKIYMLETSLTSMPLEVFLDDFRNKSCSLLGMKIEPCNESFISIYLKFTSKEEMDKTIETIKKVENSILNSIEYYLLNPVKKRKK